MLTSPSVVTDRVLEFGTMLSLVNLSHHAKGILLCVTGVLILTPDTLLIRKAAEDVNLPTLLFYRYMFHGLGVLAYVIATQRDGTMQALKQMGWIGVLCGIMLGASNILFTLAVDYTFAANVLVILASNPLFAALFSWLLVGAVIQRRTAIAMLVSLGAIALIFYDQIGGDSSPRSILGNILAMCAAGLLGLFFALVHYVEHSNAVTIDMVPCQIVGGFFVAFGMFYNSLFFCLNDVDANLIFYLCYI